MNKELMPELVRITSQPWLGLIGVTTPIFRAPSTLITLDCFQFYEIFAVGSLLLLQIKIEQVFSKTRFTKKNKTDSIGVFLPPVTTLDHTQNNLWRSINTTNLSPVFNFVTMCGHPKYLSLLTDLC